MNYPTTEFGERFLPIGTVVLLKDAQKRLIIIGYDVKNNANAPRDYCGCFFPEGLKGPTSLMVFDHSKIDKVYHMGLRDEESEKFFENLNSLVSQRATFEEEAKSENSNIEENNKNNPYNNSNLISNPIPTDNNGSINVQGDAPIVGSMTLNQTQSQPAPAQPVVEEPIINEEELGEPVIDENELEEPSLIDDNSTPNNPGQYNGYNNM